MEVAKASFLESDFSAEQAWTEDVFSSNDEGDHKKAKHILSRTL